MGVQSSVEGPNGQSAHATLYRRKFIVEVHRLLSMGHARLDIPALQKLQEPAITAKLVEAMDSIIEDQDSPRWAHRYAVYNDPPVKVAGREGKKSPRVDIRIRRTDRGPHPRFELEAKKLKAKDAKSVGAYVGEAGLGCFISGQYARLHEDAGMLGYVMSESAGFWEEKINARLEKDRETCRLIQSWGAAGHIRELASCHCTVHNREGNERSLTVYHTLLSLVPQAATKGER